MMKNYVTFLLFSLLTLTSMISYGQIENPDNTIKFEKIESNSSNPEGLELPATPKPSLTDQNSNKRSFSNLEEKEEKLDITKGDGLLEYKTDFTPKAFKKDKEADPKYGRDQSLGSVSTGAAYVHVKYRDHEYVDGDRIRVFVNDDIVKSDVSLEGSFRGIKLPLTEGLNRIDFQALNQGTSGPNTAELHVYDDKGLLISAKEWNLLTGNKATIIVNKQ